MSKDLTNVFKYMRRHEKLELLEFTNKDFSRLLMMFWVTPVPKKHLQVK